MTSTPPPPAPASSSRPNDSKSSNVDSTEIDKLLNREAKDFERQIEVERILKAFKLNPYDILDIDEFATQEEIKKRFRQLSLFIHPDKANHPRAPEAFDILKKAECELSDQKKREELDALVKEACITVLKALDLPTSTPHTDHRLQGLTPSFKVRLRLQSKELLIEEEVRRRKAIKMNLANEGLEARKKEEEVEAKKRKVQEDKVWEDTREQRVDSWRSFSKDTRKKKKQKTGSSILG